MSPDRNTAGYVPRLLSAAAFVTNRATETSLAELRLTQERTAVLRLLVESPAGEAMIAEASGLPAGCVRDCVLALQCCGYITSGPDGLWAVTPSGAKIQASADDAEVRLMSRGNDDVGALRQELHALIQALTPPPADPAPK
ncbi:hypothetical protein [Arthrobacter sp. UYP6]|uniref:hypothetical protein n=1 Tax=Arthrobacter sp. UYP6 TaxID=1756378 RepID=UPI0033956DB4